MNNFEKNKKTNKHVFLLFILTITLIIVYALYNHDNTKSAYRNNKTQTKENRIEAENPSKKIIQKDQHEDEVFSSENYDSIAINIDDEYNERFENVFPIVPLDKLENEFADREELEMYVSSILSDIEAHTIEAIEIADLCHNKNNVLSRAGDNEKLKLYYQVLFENCSKVTWENDIFFIVEKMAFSGNKFEQLNYLNNLNNAINRKVINPLANPYEYIEKRDTAIGWLNNLASKGVVAAYENLASLYMSGHNVKRDNVLAYYYALKASENALVTDYSDFYFSRLKSRMSKSELSRLERILSR